MMQHGPVRRDVVPQSCGRVGRGTRPHAAGALASRVGCKATRSAGWRTRRRRIRCDTARNGNAKEDDPCLPSQAMGQVLTREPASGKQPNRRNRKEVMVTQSKLCSCTEERRPLGGEQRDDTLHP